MKNWIIGLLFLAFACHKTDTVVEKAYEVKKTTVVRNGLLITMGEDSVYINKGATNPFLYSSDTLEFQGHFDFGDIAGFSGDTLYFNGPRDVFMYQNLDGNFVVNIDGHEFFYSLDGALTSIEANHVYSDSIRVGGVWYSSADLSGTGGTINGTVTAGEIAYGSAPNTITSSPNLLFGLNEASRPMIQIADIKLFDYKGSNYTSANILGVEGGIHSLYNGLEYPGYTLYHFQNLDLGYSLPTFSIQREILYNGHTQAGSILNILDYTENASQLMIDVTAGENTVLQLTQSVLRNNVYTSLTDSLFLDYIGGGPENLITGGVYLVLSPTQAVDTGRTEVASWGMRTPVPDFKQMVRDTLNGEMLWWSFDKKQNKWVQTRGVKNTDPIATDEAHTVAIELAYRKIAVQDSIIDALEKQVSNLSYKPGDNDRSNEAVIGMVVLVFIIFGIIVYFQNRTQK